jgi:hypothetical protein
MVVYARVVSVCGRSGAANGRQRAFMRPVYGILYINDNVHNTHISYHMTLCIHVTIRIGPAWFRGRHVIAGMLICRRAHALAARHDCEPGSRVAWSVWWQCIRRSVRDGACVGVGSQWLLAFFFLIVYTLPMPTPPCSSPHWYVVCHYSMVVMATSSTY